MLNFLNKKSLLVSAALAVTVFAGCATPTNTTPPTPEKPDNGTEVASMLGKVTKDDGTPANNGTVILIQKEGGADKDLQIVSSNDSGEYRFTKVPQGNYRVAFSGLSKKEREEKAGLAYDPAGKSGQYFGFLTTAPFDYDGNTQKTFDIPSFNVGWKANLAPHKAEKAMADGVVFSWDKAANAKEYNVLIKDKDGNPFYKSANTDKTTWTWTAEKMKSNTGSTIGAAAKPGLYYFIVNVVFDKPVNTNAPYIVNGGSAEAEFTLK